MKRIFQAAMLAAVLALTACGSTTPDSSRAPADATTAAPAAAVAVAPVAAAPVADAPVIEPAAPAAPDQTQAKPRFIDFYATW